MTFRFFLGSENLNEHCSHDYFVELIDGPHSPLYVHAEKGINSDGLVFAKISYSLLKDTVGQPYHALAKSVYRSSVSRI